MRIFWCYEVDKKNSPIFVSVACFFAYLPSIYYFNSIDGNALCTRFRKPVLGICATEVVVKNDLLAGFVPDKEQWTRKY